MDTTRVEGKSLWPELLFLAAVMAVGFYLRVRNYSEAFPNGEFSPFADDPYYHVRRIHEAVRNYPRLPSFDPYLCYPKGANSICRPFIHLTVASVAMALGAGHPSDSLVNHVAAFFPPVVGVLTVAAAFFLAHSLFGRAAACLGAGFIALVPAHVSVTQLGRVDHDSMEILLSVCLVWLVGRAVSEGRLRFLCAGVAGCVLTVAFITWYVSIYFVIVLCGYACVQAIAEAAAGRDLKAMLRPILVVLASALAAFLILSIGFPSLVESRNAFLGIPAFELVVLVAALGYVLYLIAASLVCARRGLRWVWFGAMAVFGPMVVILASALVCPVLLGPLKGYAWMFLGKDPVMNMLANCEGMFYLGGRFRPEVAEVALTRAVYLFPVAFGILAVRAVREKGKDHALVLFLAWTAAGSFLALRMKRFDGQLTVWVGIVLAAVLVGLRPRFQAVRAEWGQGKAAAAAFWLLVAVAGLFLVLPGVGYYVPIARKYTSVAEKYEAIRPAYRKALLWLRENSPPVSPDRKLDFAVMAEWPWGYWIQYFTGRPTVTDAGNMQIGLRGPFLDGVRFLFADREDEANRIAADYNVRYVITTFFPRHIKQYCAMAGMDVGRYVHITRNDAGLEVFSLRPDYYATMASRLHDTNGAEFRVPEDGRLVGALRRYRLIYEGEPEEDLGRRASLSASAVKIFERVEGATLVGYTQPHSVASATVEVTTNQQRSFLYRASHLVGNDGRFEIVVPYPTLDSPYRTCAVLPYTVTAAQGAASVDVPEEAVREGKTVKVQIAQ